MYALELKFKVPTIECSESKLDDYGRMQNGEHFDVKKVNEKDAEKLLDNEAKQTNSIG